MVNVSCDVGRNYDSYYYIKIIRSAGRLRSPARQTRESDNALSPFADIADALSINENLQYPPRTVANAVMIAVPQIREICGGTDVRSIV